MRRVGSPRIAGARPVRASKSASSSITFALPPARCPSSADTRAQRPGHPPDRVHPIPSAIELRGDGRESRIQGGNGGLPGNFRDQEAVRAVADVEQCPGPVEACGSREARAVDLPRELPRGDGEHLSGSPPKRAGRAAGEDVRELARALLKRPSLSAKLFELGLKFENPRPFGSNDVECRGEARPLRLQIDCRFRRDAREDLQGTGTQGGDAGARRNRTCDDVMHQLGGRRDGASLLIGECVSPVGFGQVIEANEQGCGEDGDGRKEQ